MIRSFADKDTENPWNRIPVKRWSGDVQRVAYRKLLVIDAAESLQDLRIPSGNRLEKLKGDRPGQDSIRINKQWRICFYWRNDGAEEVEINKHYE